MDFVLEVPFKEGSYRLVTGIDDRTTTVRMFLNPTSDLGMKWLLSLVIKRDEDTYVGCQEIDFDYSETSEYALADGWFDIRVGDYTGHVKVNAKLEPGTMKIDFYLGKE